MATTPLTIGDGDRKVVCLHGWFGSSRGWGSWPDVLDATRFTYVFPDCRGYGQRKHEPGELTVEEVASDTVALADRLGWETFSVIGHSMGGKAAARVLADVPERVERVVGISPVPAEGVPFDGESWGLFEGAAHDDGNRAAIINITTGGKLSPYWIQRAVAHSVEHSTREAFGAYLVSWAKGDFSSDLSGLDVPMKIVVGENDPALGAATMEQTWLKTFPSAELDTLANAGHYAMYETPIVSATLVEEFLSRES